MDNDPLGFRLGVEGTQVLLSGSYALDEVLLVAKAAVLYKAVWDFRNYIYIYR